jgi:outer membrane scaffolding protein for murein synthesis (MipA/OmpV family)
MKRSSYLLTTTAVIMVLGVFSAPLVHAESHFTLGAAGFTAPDYEGSDDYKTRALPYAAYEWTNDSAPTQSGVFLGFHGASIGVDTGLDLEWLRIQGQTHRLSGHSGLAYDIGRKERYNREALSGLGDVDGHAIGLLSLEYGPADEDQQHFITASLKGAFDMSDETRGTEISFGIQSNHVFDNGFLVSFGPGITWADDNYMQSYFGINKTQVARSSKYTKRFDAESGLKSAEFDLSATYFLDENWMIIGNLQYMRLMSDAEDSPLVKREGSANQFTAGIGLGYLFY